jgi:hypothetical protein
MPENKEHHDHHHGHTEHQGHHPHPPEREIVEVVEVIEIVELVDIEEHAKKGKKPPKAKKYRIRVDKEYFIVEVSSMTGAQILKLANKTPIDRWMLNQKHRGGKISPVGPDQVVDFVEHEVERFMTLPKDQTEGSL